MKITLALLLCLLLVGCNSMLSKFVTSGANADNVPVYSQVIHGNSLKPLAPANVRGSRDASGNLLIEWTRRSRLGGGLRPNTDVPIAEEREYYELEIMSGSVVLRTIRVGNDDAHAVQWRNTGIFAPVTPANDGTLLQSAVDAIAHLQSIEKIYGDFRLEMLIDHSTRLGETQCDGAISILPARGAWPGGGVVPGYVHSDTAVLIENDGAKVLYCATGDRVMIELRGTTFYYFKNYAGGQSQPSFTSTQSGLSFPLIIQGELIGSSFTPSTRLDNITKPTLQRFAQPDYLYPVVQQTADLGSVSSSIKVRVYQVSAIVGRGPYTEATL